MNQQLEITILLKEYAVVSEEIKARIGTDEKALGFGVAILGVGLTWAIKESIREILLFLPIGLFGIFFFSLLNTSTLVALAGYRKYLADRINAKVESKILVWEAIGRTLVAKNPNFFAVSFVYLLFLTTLIVIGLRAAWAIGYKTFSGYAAIIVILSIGVAMSFRRLYSIFSKAYERAVESSDFKTGGCTAEKADTSS